MEDLAEGKQLVVDQRSDVAIIGLPSQLESNSVTETPCFDAKSFEKCPDPAPKSSTFLNSRRISFDMMSS